MKSFSQPALHSLMSISSFSFSLNLRKSSSVGIPPFQSMWNSWSSFLNLLSLSILPNVSKLSSATSKKSTVSSGRCKALTLASSVSAMMSPSFWNDIFWAVGGMCVNENAMTLISAMVEVGSQLILTVDWFP